jgi:acyl-CoA thioester hydrolase
MNQNGVTATQFRVRYAETDQMGVAHHAHYVIWCEQARTEHMRAQGVSYGSVEKSGLLLPVVAVNVRYKAPARYEDLVRVRCWVREVSRRHVEFGYAVEQADDSCLLATARTTLMAVDTQRRRATIPDSIRAKLVPVEDPVRI